MRVVLSVLFFLVQGLMAEVQEVRSYRVENLAEHRFFEREVDLDAEGIPLEEWLGAVVTKAPFASRFLKDVTEMRDFTPSLAAMFAQKFTGKAVYDPKSGRLVVQTIPREHSMLQQVLKWRGPVMIQTEVSVYRSPGVVTENRTLFPDEEIVGAELLGNVGGLHLPGQGFEVRTPEGNLELKGEGQVDLNDHTVELGLKLNSALPLGKFRLDTRLWLSAGKPLRYEVGSLDGGDFAG